MEDVPKMSFAGDAADFRARDGVTAIAQFLDGIGCDRRGEARQPVPDSNLVSDRNSGVLQATRR